MEASLYVAAIFSRTPAPADCRAPRSKQMNDNKHQHCQESYQGLMNPVWPNERTQKKIEGGKKGE
jgi:hypothetical protein